MENESKIDDHPRNTPVKRLKKTPQTRRRPIEKLKGFYKQIGGQFVIRARNVQDAINIAGRVARVMRAETVREAIYNDKFINLLSPWEATLFGIPRSLKPVSAKLFPNLWKYKKIVSPKLDGSQDEPDLSSAVALVGAVPGMPVEAETAHSVLSRIAHDATDLFATAEEASSFLESANLDGKGNNALQLIEAGRTASVLARLDELRFGSQG